MKTCIDYYNDNALAWAQRWYPDNSNIPHLKRFLEYINIQNPKILDLCCGAGYESMRLKNLGANVVGVDLSEKSIEIAKKQNPEIIFYVKDMLKPYSNLGKFDGIACIAGIVHLEEHQLELAFENMYDALAENGYLLLVCKAEGENRYSTIENNQEYARNFIFHSRQEIDQKAEKYFSFVEDLSPETEWKFFIYKKI